MVNWRNTNCKRFLVYLIEKTKFDKFFILFVRWKGMVKYMIKKIHEEDIAGCVNVIKERFLTVADDLGYTVDNAPHFTAFATTEDGLLYQLKNEHRPIFKKWIANL